MSELTQKLKQRRSYRTFETEGFDIQILIEAIEAAKHAPSGANKQPWTFCIIQDASIKSNIRKEAELVEEKFYQTISKTWRDDLTPLSVDTQKPFLEDAPYLIVIFKHLYQFDSNGFKTKVYYPDISVGIATGMLITVLTDFGIDVLTYTPKPDAFLKDILKRPENEKPYLILVCGKGSKNYTLPKITKKPNEEIMKIY